MKKTLMINTIRAATRISKSASFRFDPRVCSVCGRSSEQQPELKLDAHQECDEWDKATGVVVFVCDQTSCRAALRAHPRLYRQFIGDPGTFPTLCGPCIHRNQLLCKHPDLKANGGPGLVVTTRSNLPAGTILCGRGGRIDPAKAATACAGRHVLPLLCTAVLPDGQEARRVTAHRYTHALCVPQAGRAGGWCVLRWSSNGKRLEAEAKKRNKQSHGERTAVVVPVEIVAR